MQSKVRGVGEAALAAWMARIEDFDLTEWTIEKLWRHRIDPHQLYAVIARRDIVTRNRSGRAAPFVLIGRNDQGRRLAIPIVQTDDPRIWRPITAWYCKPGEAAKLG